MPRHKRSDTSIPPNSATPEQAAEIIHAIEEEHRKLLNLRMDYMRDCKPFHEEVKAIIDRGVNSFGMSRRAIKAKIKERDHQRKAEAERAKLDAEEIDAFDRLSEQLGPLGEAARQNFQQGKDPLSSFAA